MEGRRAASLDFSFPSSKFLARGRICSSAKKPWLNNCLQGSRWNITVQNLFGMIPSHPTLGNSTSNYNKINRHGNISKRI
mmetsp:Transcript_21096/g.30603  ORF Transcript_21096/g.30603 Transcript_21096/m.30603 type:complete len:80 (-) Transcript_21096:116-355(-)